MHLKKKLFTAIALMLVTYFLALFSLVAGGSKSDISLVDNSSPQIEHAQFLIDVNDLSQYAERVEVVNLSTSSRFQNFNLIRTLIGGRSVSYPLSNTLFIKPFRHLQIVEQHLSIPIVLRRLLI